MPDGLDVDDIDEEETTDNEDSESQQSESQTGTETETETESEMSQQHGQKGEYFGNRNAKGERHGRGRSVLPNGDIYLGCYYRGKRHGLGVYRYKKGKGARYGGDWSFGEKNGWGTFYFPDGSQYTGSWYKGLKHGWGSYVYSNGDEYEGWWYCGEKNNRGIYRTKSTGEKYVGYWLLGDRHGEGMIIRKNHKYIGYWHKDVPKGEGVFIYPELNIEQHGTYIHFKVSPGQEEKWIDEGHQVRTIRADEPPQNPYSLERSLAQGGGGEVTVLNDSDSVKSNAAPMDDDEVFYEMKTFVEKETSKGQTNRISIIPMWRNIKVTTLITKLLDEDVPPPSMPSTPGPPTDDELDSDAQSQGQDDQSQGPGESEKDGGENESLAEATDGQPEESEDDLTTTRRLAQSHHLNEPYIGSGVSQEDDLGYKGLEGEVYNRFSEMSLSNVPEFQEKVKEKVEKIMSGPFSNADGDSMENSETLSERWRYTLKNGNKCLVAGKTRISGPPVVQNAPADADDNQSSMNPSVKQSASQMSSKSKSNNSAASGQGSMKSQSQSSSKSSIKPSSSKVSSKSSQSKMEDEESNNEGDEEEEDDGGNEGMLRLEEESLDESQYVGSEYYDENASSTGANNQKSQNDEGESSTGPDEESILVINPSDPSNVVVDKDNVPIALEEKMTDFKDIDEEE